MTNDQKAHSAERSTKVVAALIALPLALLAAFVVFQVMRPGSSPAPEAAASPSARPMATSPVTVAAPSLGERQATVCRALISQLPEQVRDLGRRPITAGHEQNAAYGDPAITVACGVPAPTFPPTDDVFVLDGVCWHQVTGPDGAAWTTVDREVPVTVTVPNAYQQAAQWTINFSATVIATVPSAKQTPFGCTGK